MANIPIWPGSSSFASVTNPTPFAFYDTDTSFITDADNISDWCAKRLGYPLVDIELQDVNFYTCFEEAINEYGAQLYNFQIINNFHTLEGTTTGSTFNNQLISPNLGGTVNISDQYGNETYGGGGNYKKETGSLEVSAGVQKYDLLTTPSSSLKAITTAGSESVYIKRIYHYQPAAINRYFDPYAGTGVGMQQMMESFGWGSFSPAINFMLMPINYDLQKIQAIELNDQIRKSQYTFELVNNKLRVFPIPNDTAITYLSFHYVKLEETNNPYYDRDGREIITNASNVPYENPNYTRINSIGRQWIFEYALSLVKEILGYVRGKYSQIPIPGSEVTLNQSDLISAATAEKAALVERLRAYFDTTSRKTLLEKKAEEGAAQNKIISEVPMVIYVG